MKTSLQLKKELADYSSGISSTIADIVSATKETIENHHRLASELSVFSQKVVSRLSADDAAELLRILDKVTMSYDASILNLKTQLEFLQSNIYKAEFYVKQFEQSGK